MPDTNPPRSDLHVLIIGAGITGLVLAQGLQKAGICFTIFEREPVDYQPTRDWGIAIHWSVPMLEKLLPATLYARLPEVLTDPCHPNKKIFEAVSIYNGQTGELLRDTGMPGMIRVDRNRMRKLCGTGILVQHDKSLTSLTYGANGTGVTAHFHDGTTATGDIIIGADGARSIVRELLLGKEKAALTASPVINLMAKVNFNDAERAVHVRSGNPILKLAFHPNRAMIQNVLNEDDPRTWTFLVGASWPGKAEGYPDNETRLAALRKATEDFCEPYRSATLWIPEGTRVSNNGTHYWVTIPWDNHDGRVTLAGDAAHPMTPHRGQGLNNGILDVVNLVNALVELPDKSSLPGLVSKYEAEMVPRGAAEVKTSVENSNLAHNWDTIMESGLITKGVERSAL